VENAAAGVADSIKRRLMNILAIMLSVSRCIVLMSYAFTVASFRLGSYSLSLIGVRVETKL
jgi:hypothetical protein